MAGLGALGGFVIPFFLGFSKDNFTNGQARGIFVFTILSAIGLYLTDKLMRHLDGSPVRNHNESKNEQKYRKKNRKIHKLS